MSADHASRIFIVDDHPLVRDALAQLLAGAGFEVSGGATDVREALAHPALAACRLAIIDLSLGAESGLDLIRRLRILGIAVLVYSMHKESNVIRRALEAGASGYVTKSETASSLLDAVRALLAGARYLSPRVEAALRESSSIESLSGQQRQIYRLLGQGFSNEEIAGRLAISVRTLESYCVRIMDKLGAQGARELRRQAIRDAAHDIADEAPPA
ncbi:MAG TPA: response regulator transcription factor [Kiritimatiellia bacterium]|nr:response regulator transcription factor [Kiritimatiellia bacterium]HRU71584.1 response regulator transcription factor [Kiritimatiellia bacterium]